MQEVTQKGYRKSTQAAFTTVKPVTVTDAIYQASVIGGGSSSQRVLPRQMATGTYNGQQAYGSNNVRVDNGASQIVVNDDLNDRVLLGKKPLTTT